jgi:short-subunit dehydrogenase
MSFINKVVWITGASSGIGKSLAIELSNQDAKLILSSRNTVELECVKRECKSSENVKIIELDLDNYVDFAQRTKEAIDCFGRLDILINNAGISQRSLAKDTGLRVDEKIMKINYLGTVALTKAVLPYFIEKKAGHFVTTTSIVGKIGTPLRSSYAASKHALHGFFDSLRAEIHPYAILVTLVCPGFVNTNISLNALIGDGSSQQKMDTATKNGIDPSLFAKLMLIAIKNKKQEVYIAGFKEKLGVFVKRFSPKLFATMIRKMSVT